MERWDQARAAVAFLWEKDVAALKKTIGDVALLAPIPTHALDRGHRPWDWD
jgi:hypothetical protein